LSGVTEVFAKTGDLITLAWSMPNPLPPGLLYYRIRCAEKISGPFVVCYQIPANVLSYTFTFNKTASTYYFVTRWFSSVQPDGTALISESTGSNMIRIRITK